jgi:uncharacterized protein (TIGR03435 family)
MFTRKLLLLTVLSAITTAPTSLSQTNPAESQPAIPAVLPPMGADANPSFEAVTIKPSDPKILAKRLGLGGRRFTTQNYTVNDLIVFAYGVNVKQIVGAPVWFEKDKFDITGVPDAEGHPSAEQWKTMIQKLMKDRFKLTFHRDKRELAAYVLTVGKDGPKLARNTSTDSGQGSVNIHLAHDGLMLVAHNETMAEFTETLQHVVVDRPVVDRTGFEGRFDFQLTFAPDGGQFDGMRLPPTNEDSAAPSLFTEIQEQMGLRLEPVNTPIEVMVIDHVEEPSPN